MGRGAAWLLLLVVVSGAGAARGEVDALARWQARLASEEQLVVDGAALLVAAGKIHDPDAPQLPGALRAAYAELRASPPLPAPTFAGLASPDAADVIILDAPAARGAVIFLHGYAGGFALPCAQVARAARAAGLATLCPSVGWSGDWWNAGGERALRRTVALAQARGWSSLYLAGLSNGAHGAAALAPRLRGVFAGVIVISGAGRDAAAPGVPVLAVQGRRDTMSSPGWARAYARRAGGDYVELDAGHFALLLRHAEAERAISAWLRRH